MRLTRSLPLFQLHVVLFPGMPLALHIFEERYRLLIRHCLASQAPFVVALIRSGSEVGGQAQPHTLGTVARIARSERLPDGRFNVEVVGQERVAIASWRTHLEPYPVAEIRRLPLPDGDGEAAARLAEKLRPYLARYVALLDATLPTQHDAPALPAQPEALAWHAAAQLQIPLDDKQSLLSAASCTDLLERLRYLLRREAALLRAVQADPAGARPTHLSSN